MNKRSILLLMLSLCSNSERYEDMFNLDPDDIFASEIGGDFYESRKRLQRMPFNINDTKLKSNATTKPPSTTTKERILMATIPPEIAAEYKNISLRDIKIHRLKLQLDRIFSNSRSASDYLAGSAVETMTRRFDELVKKNQKKNGRKTRREIYDSDEDPDIKWDAKRRLINLMTHFIYISRYKLVYPQLLRKKYLENNVYKIGFLFALLRHLKNMQKWIYYAMKVHGEPGPYVFGTVFYDLKMLEKLQRLDIDIKDVVLLIEKMEYRANIAFNPKFYDYSLET